MDVNFRKADDSERRKIRELLETVELPAESVESGTTTFYIAEENGSVAGIAGFEFYGKDALLRSVAVRPKLQKKGIGGRIVDSMISVARDRHMSRMVLLTETAQKFFERKGFTVIDRATIDNDALKQSSEFTVACPKSAVCMVFNLR